MKAPGRGRVVVSVIIFGMGALDGANGYMSPEECEAMAAAWTRAAEAIRGREYGKVQAMDSDGDEMLDIGMDYKTVEFDDVKGLPLLGRYETARTA